MLQILTSSSLACYRQCPRRYQLRYEFRLVRAVEAVPLRIGHVTHGAYETHSLGGDAVAYIGEAYATKPELAVERETVIALFAGHAWRYEADGYQFLAAELPWELPLTNPDTGASSRTYCLAGKIDAIVRLPDSRLAVLEYKTAGEDISDESQYWLRLRCDAQISLYLMAAQALAADGKLPGVMPDEQVATIIYDVTRKPTIRPREIPELDAEGLKVVLDSAGQRVLTKQGKPRQTGDTELGYVLQTRTETADEFRKRLIDDIGDRPDYYYARREVPRLDSDLAEFQAELWQQAQQLHESRRRGRWFRSCTRWNCPNCEYADLCLQNVAIDPAAPPVGFEVIADANPELAE